VNAVAKLAILQDQGGVNVLPDSMNGGLRFPCPLARLPVAAIRPREADASRMWRNW
jgi:hypothetical protein